MPPVLRADRANKKAEDQIERIAFFSNQPAPRADVRLRPRCHNLESFHDRSHRRRTRDYSMVRGDLAADVDD